MVQWLNNCCQPFKKMLPMWVHFNLFKLYPARTRQHSISQMCPTRCWLELYQANLTRPTNTSKGLACPPMSYLLSFFSFCPGKIVSYRVLECPPCWAFLCVLNRFLFSQLLKHLTMQSRCPFVITIIPHICHFFTLAKFLENKNYTKKTRKLRQNTQ